MPKSPETPSGVTCVCPGSVAVSRWPTGHPYGVRRLGWTEIAINRPPLMGFKSGRTCIISSAQTMGFQMWGMTKACARFL
jgi:hypothetical protein